MCHGKGQWITAFLIELSQPCRVFLAHRRRTARVQPFEIGYRVFVGFDQVFAWLHRGFAQTPNMSSGRAHKSQQLDIVHIGRLGQVVFVQPPQGDGGLFGRATHQRLHGKLQQGMAVGQVPIEHIRTIHGARRHKVHLRLWIAIDFARVNELNPTAGDFGNLGKVRVDNAHIYDEFRRGRLIEHKYNFCLGGQRIVAENLRCRRGRREARF